MTEIDIFCYRVDCKWISREYFIVPMKNADDDCGICTGAVRRSGIREIVVDKDGKCLEYEEVG